MNAADNSMVAAAPSTTKTRCVRRGGVQVALCAEFEFIAALGRGAEAQRDTEYQQPAEDAGTGDDQHFPSFVGKRAPVRTTSRKRRRFTESVLKCRFRTLDGRCVKH